MKKDKFKYGFALTELLIAITIMAVLSLLVVFAVAKKTKKVLLEPKNGTFICYKDMNGNLHQKIEQIEFNGESTFSDEQVGECEFNIPANAESTMVYIIGGGGGGAPSVSNPKFGVSLNNIGLKLKGYEFQKKLEMSSGKGYAAPTTYCYTSTSIKKPIDFRQDVTLANLVTSREDGSYDCGVTPRHFGIDKLYAFYYMQKQYCRGEGGQSYPIGEIVNSSANSGLRRYFESSYISYLLKNGLKSDYIGPEVYYPYFKKTVGSYTLEMKSDRCRCYQGFLKCKQWGLDHGSSLHSNFVDAMTRGELFTAKVYTVSSLNSVPIGLGGGNGASSRIDVGASYAGKTIKISKDKIGNGGAVGSPGGKTTFEDEWGMFKEDADGGAAGGVLRMTKGVHPKYVQLAGNTNLEINNIEPFSISDKRGISSYYSYDENGENLSKDDIIIPNSICTVNGDKYEISKFEDYEFKNNILLNYGGGGGGYFPCVKYGSISSAQIDYLKEEIPATITYKYKDGDGKMIPEYIAGKSTGGMGGAIIIKWRGK